jgi:ankyrin repeat protein
VVANNGDTALSLATDFGHDDIVQLLCAALEADMD